MRQQQAKGGLIDTVLLETGRLREADLLNLLGEASGFRPVNLADFEPNAEVATLIPPKIAERLCVVPLSLDGNTLHVACGFPVPRKELDEVGFLLGKPLELWVATEVRVREWIAVRLQAAAAGALRGPAGRAQQAAGCHRAHAGARHGGPLGAPAASARGHGGGRGGGRAHARGAGADGALGGPGARRPRQAGGHRACRGSASGQCRSASTSGLLARAAAPQHAGWSRGRSASAPGRRASGCSFSARGQLGSASGLYP